MSVELDLRRPPGARWGDLALALTCAVALGGWAMFCLATPGLRGSAVLAVPALWWAWRVVRRYRAPHRLLVQAAALTIESPPALRRPVRLEKSEVLGVMVDDSDVEHGWERLRFPVARGWYLWSSARGSTLTRLNDPRDLPNVAIVLSPGALRAAGAIERGAVAQRAERPRGLVVSVRDPEAAVIAFAGWGLEGPPGLPPGFAPLAHDEHGFRYGLRPLLACLAVTVAALALSVVAAGWTAIGFAAGAGASASLIGIAAVLAARSRSLGGRQRARAAATALLGVASAGALIVQAIVATIA